MQETSLSRRTGLLAVRYTATGQPAAAAPRGFALIIALVLMAFIVLLLLSLASMTAVELNEGTVRNDAERARKNALLGLSVALGELQATLGPDQRISSTADITSGVNDRRKAWTGVYKSWDITAGENRPSSPDFVRWLVSGDADALKNRNTAVSGTIGEVYTDLVRGAAATRVEAGLVAVEDTTGTGAFAWWVGDENVKARIGYDKGSEKELTNWLERRQGGAGSRLTGLSYTKDVDPADPRLSMELSRDMLKLLNAEAGKDEQFLQSLTPYSFGLLTNVRSGGLRKDLSFYLETSEAARPLDPLYTHDGRNGVHFGELWAYYNLWRKLETASGRAHPDGGTLPANVPILKGSTSGSVEHFSPFGFYNRPLMVMGGWLISVQSSDVADEPTKRQMQVVADAVMVLWNPYDVSIDVPTQTHIRMRFASLPYLLEIFADGVSLNPGGTSFTGGDGLFKGNSIHVFAGNNTSQPLRLRPGEVLFYSQAGSSGTKINDLDDITFDTDTSTEKRMDSFLGWNRSGGIILDVGSPVDEDAPIEVQMFAEARRSNGSNELFTIEERMGNSGRVSGGFHIDRAGWELNNMKPSEFPKIFTGVSRRELALASDLIGTASGATTGKFPVGFFSMSFRTEESDGYPSRFLTRASRASAGIDLQDLTDENLVSQGVDIRMQTFSGINDNPGFDVLGGKGFFGGSYQASSGNTRIITQSIPRAPIYSLAAFKHATAGGMRPLRWYVSGENINDYFHLRKLEPTVAKIIGNSHALSILAPGDTRGVINDGHPAADHSYLANLALWDDWFFSSISPRNSAMHKSAGINQGQQDVFDAFISGQTALPNPRMKLYGGADTVTMRSNLFQMDGSPTSDAHKLAAESLMVEGMFNVNSTDVDAWVGVLSALRSDAVAVASSSGAISWKSDDARTPLASLLLPAEDALSTSDLSDTAKDKQWLGYRDFSDAEIRELAVEIVAEIRRRGPFLSIADFVNRRVGSDRDLAKSSALQTALDRVINTRLMQGSRGVSSSDMPSGLAFPEAEAGARSTGSAAYVDQADLLTIIGPGINVRSDTFIIRTYGDIRNGANDVIATARCEAVVQRMPDYIDPSDAPHLAYSELNDLNKLFGRQFKVVSFRWLDEDDI